MLVVDAGTDSMGLGAAASTSTRLNIGFATLVVPVNGQGTFVTIQPALTEAASGTHSIMAGVAITALSLTGAGAATDDAATLYVAGAPTGATRNYAFWVDAGAARFDGNIGFFSTAPVAQQAGVEDVTNNVTAGGTDGTIANYTDLVTYSNDAAAIRNDIYQLARSLAQAKNALRTYGLLS